MLKSFLIQYRCKRAFEDGNRVFEKNISSIKSLCEKDPEFWDQWNFILDTNLYFSLAGFDLHTLLAEVSSFSMNLWRRKLHMRHSAVLLVEYFEDVPEILGKEFRSKMYASPSLASILPGLEQTMKNFRLERRASEAQLRILRNIASAHRDKASLNMLRAIEDIDPIAMQKTMLRVYKMNSSFIAHMTAALQAMENITKKP